MVQIQSQQSCSGLPASRSGICERPRLDMRLKDTFLWRCSVLAFVLNVFFFLIAFGSTLNNDVTQVPPHSDASPSVQAASLDQSPTAQPTSRQASGSAAGSANSKSQSEKSTRSSKATLGTKKTAEASSNEEKKRQALSMLENVLLGTERINPLEYQVLTQVEAASVLWQLDKQQAVSILKSALKTMRREMEEKNVTTEVNPYRRTKEQMLWFLAIRKIAALDPNLVWELLLGEPDEKAKDASRIKGVWTEEARAMLSVASELIDRDPKLAARTAEQTLSLGLASYLEFLRSLARRDNAEAERLAMVIIDRFSTALSVTPIELRNLMAFVSAPERTSRLKNYSYQALAARLRLEFRPHATAEELADALGVANTMARVAGRDSTYWKQQFDSISVTIATLFKERSLPFPIPPDRISIDTVSLNAASAGNTQEIRDALLRVGSIKDSKARNREYQKLAVSAATSADKVLAEEIMSRITDDGMRLETSTLVYSPLIRSAIADSTWNQAQQLASLIQDPLARTLVFGRIAQEMAKSGEDKFAIIDAYSMALAKLYRDDPTDRVAKSYLLLAKPLLELDRDRGIGAIRSSSDTMSRISTTEAPVQESVVGTAASTWLRYSDRALLADEVLNLPELVTTTFSEVAGRDPENALDLATWVNHRGMHSLAQLAIIKVLLKEANQPVRSNPTRN